MVLGLCLVSALAASAQGTVVYQINCGGGSVGTFTADSYYSGGSAYSVTNTIDTDLPPVF